MSRLRRIPVKQFNKICIVLAALWLLVTIPLGIRLRPTVPDFEQFYMGGVVARLNEWQALYPSPRPGSLDNPGLRIHSEAKPEWKLLSKKLGVWDHTHFMLPPVSALLFVPLSVLSYKQAFWLWTAIQTLCIWSMALIAAHLLRRIARKPTHMEGLLVLLIALSPLAARAVRIANVSPPIALAIAVSLLAIVREHRPLSGALALLIGAIFKYATLVLTPLLVAMRRWEMLFYLAAFGALSFIVTVHITGFAPFIEFYQKILPTLDRPSAFLGNQSLPGMLVRSFGRPLPEKIALALNVARLLTLLAILGVLFTQKQATWSKPANVLAGAALLMSWLLIFSPIAWEHWPIFLCPVWGWVLWEARKPGVKRALAVTSLLLMYFPAGIFQVKGVLRLGIAIPEPYNSSQLAGTMLLLALAFWRLAKQRAYRSLALGQALSEAQRPRAAMPTGERLPRDIQRLG